MHLGCLYDEAQICVSKFFTRVKSAGQKFGLQLDIWSKKNISVLGVLITAVENNAVSEFALGVENAAGVSHTAGWITEKLYGMLARFGVLVNATGFNMFDNHDGDVCY